MNTCTIFHDGEIKTVLSAGRISPSENADLISLDNGKKLEAGSY